MSDFFKPLKTNSRSLNDPFRKIKFISQVKGRQLYLVYDFDRRKDEFWV